MKPAFALILFALAFFPVSSFAGHAGGAEAQKAATKLPDPEAVADEELSPAAEAADIVTTLSLNPDFSVFTNALEASGLTETLKGEGPFTIFAPTNEAFAALEPGTMDVLMRPENKARLISLISYHILSRVVTTGDIAGGINEEASLEGSVIRIAREADGIAVDAAQIISPDIPATNGIIHMIDKVNLP